MKVDEALRARVIQVAVAVLEKEYVFPKAVAKLDKRLAAHVAAKRYDSIKSPDKLAKLLSADIHEVVRDTTVRIEYSPEPVPEDRSDRMHSDDRTRMRIHAGQFNAFFERVERLAGNIGYLRVSAIGHPMVAAAPLAAAMSLLADTDELIFDLRGTGGSNPDTVALMISYLYEAGDSLHVSDVYWRPIETTHQYWTSSEVAGRRYPGKPVYVLTNRRTIGSAEDFAYNLRAAKRAKIVGEVTAGDAYHYRRRKLAPNFALVVPIARSVSAVTNKNWANAGVKPDIQTSEAAALDTAYFAALRSARKRTDPKRMPKDFLPNLSEEIDRALVDAQARPVKKLKKR